jgi:hypothetical protein
MQAVKNWCDGERVKKLGTLRQTKQGVVPLVHLEPTLCTCFWTEGVQWAHGWYWCDGLKYSLCPNITISSISTFGIANRY